MEYVIDIVEYRQLVHQGEVSSRIMEYWQDLLSKLPKKLKAEAKTRSFQLIAHPILTSANTGYSHNLMFHVKFASEELKKELIKPEYAVICLIDY